ncbi:bifunctional UDP-2,4-diacetamido-2,4,6-trideoxy-beta-L-altropyranose hydrolase/GNAT family N-acetyltransferase [Actinophytocola sp.]|uniref:bifunctional UDP-2,4-diacetamido-2,4,6-trideoxy-beta-L-altropyranose hydrolase/GNAT family N-acetyltransferase n=1 Tax=Actinophytocola sp. TaxID=1872138 RepID=UPI002D598312|nr:bifunctional UDP-2,4-diacetamido-2,4,6-trideoxy-beta-L-altropyranose hydrolase/GNAT family N-acetyltransferase [Actinophytocola sp.]HYQ67154.1 bifunctional UDP-2,4-diacetamido-2,4,6-trideoxy-beta-L-altropyranose hydrolase/GNAT family N-acetyltransferase [Actinophytocola sp.]
MPSLLLRADATAETGVGHLSRCVAVATAARARGWDATLCGTFTAGQWLLGDLPVVPSPQPADAVLIDHYGLGEVSLQSLVVSIEDGRFGRRRADIVVDSNLYTTDRPADGSRLVLRGPRYAPLRAEILAARAARGGGSTPPRVVVVMGGGAAPAAVAAAVEALRATGVPVTVTAISSAPVPGVEVVPPTPALPSLLASADLVVSAAGVTLLELCCIGVPAALVRIADNQKAGYEAAVTQGLAAGLGTDPRDHTADLRALLLDPERRKAMAAKAMTAVDGEGANRILNAIETETAEAETAETETAEASLSHPPHESPIGTRGGPPFSTLPAGSDESGAREGLSTAPIGLGSHERDFRAPEGPPVSTLPEGTDNADNSDGTDNAVGTGNAGNTDGSVVLRAATVGDSGLLLAWRNDPGTRAWSRTTDPVAPADHSGWLARVLDDPGRRLLIAEHGREPVGTVRLDREDDHWEISITVAPAARGRKLAVPILLAAERGLGRTTIRACVNRDNAASLAIFRRAGYRPLGADGPWLWFHKAV